MSQMPEPRAILLDGLPVDEYVRRLAERRDRAQRSIRRCLKWWSLGHILACLAVALYIGGLFWLLLAVTPVIAFLCVVPATVAAFVAVRDAAILSWLWNAAALLPWVVLCSEGYVIVVNILGL